MIIDYISHQSFDMLCKSTFMTKSIAANILKILVNLIIKNRSFVKIVKMVRKNH
jgi:hypothetical protein